MYFLNYTKKFIEVDMKTSINSYNDMKDILMNLIGQSNLNNIFQNESS